MIAEDAVSNTHLPRHRLRVWGDYQLDGGVNGEPRNLTLSLKGKHRTPSCRSELAREKLTDAAFTQKARVIVDVFREQARAYIRCASLQYPAPVPIACE